jgi:cyclase
LGWLYWKISQSSDLARIRIIPVLLLKEGGLYKTVRFQKPNYVGDPINTVKIFNEKEADEIVLLDFTASRDKRAINFSRISEIAGEAFMPMAYGGAIRSYEDAVKVFDSGFEKVVLNSVLFTDMELVYRIGRVYGAQAVVGSIDTKKNLFGKYKVFSHSGSRNTGMDPVDWARKLEEAGVGEIMVNAIDRDGTWDGYDTDLLGRVAHAVSVPVIACGGAGNMEDFRKAVASGCSAVAAGSMFVYQKKGMGVLISFPSTGLHV